LLPRSYQLEVYSASAAEYGIALRLVVRSEQDRSSRVYVQSYGKKKQQVGVSDANPWYKKGCSLCSVSNIWFGAYTVKSLLDDLTECIQQMHPSSQVSTKRRIGRDDVSQAVSGRRKPSFKAYTFWFERLVDIGIQQPKFSHSIHMQRNSTTYAHALYFRATRTHGPSDIEFRETPMQVIQNQSLPYKWCGTRSATRLTIHSEMNSSRSITHVYEVGVR